MSSKGPFTFRQRAGRLDWRKVSSVDVDDVVLNLKVEELQTLLDTVTFSEFDSLEVKSNTIEQITKLINIMQLTIEYLLHHQEHQFNLVRKQNKKIHHLVEKSESYQRRLEAMKEDVRTYQRQLHILRKSIQAGGGGINTELLFRLVQKEPKVNDPSALNTRSNVATSGTGEPMNMELVKLMLDHEHDARATMQRMLDEQGHIFQSELGRLHETIRRIQHDYEAHQSTQEQQVSANKEAWNTTTISLLLENMKSQMENTARQMMDSIKENLPSYESKNSKSTNAVRTSSSVSANNIEDILKQASMETYSRELSDKETALQNKEQELKRREAILQQSMALQNADTIANQVLFRRKCSLQILFTTIRRVNQRRILKRFRHWYACVEDSQRQELLDEHAKQLLFATEKRVQHDSETHLSLQEERQKQMILQARYNALQRELDALHESSKFNELKAEQADRTEAVLQEKLKMEREKAVIAQAKYNALQQRVDKDKDEIIAKLQVAEEIIAQQAAQIAELEQSKPLVRESVRSSRNGPWKQYV